ncbi:hypothetical protein STEG23_016779 [Scotinomys teguina]
MIQLVKMERYLVTIIIGLGQTTQDAPEEVRNRDFRRELEERERAAAREKNRDRPTREHTTSSSVSKKPRLDQIPAANLDADDPLTDEEDEDFEEESDDDDTAALLAELEKIKKERAEEQARKRLKVLIIQVFRLFS